MQFKDFQIFVLVFSPTCLPMYTKHPLPRLTRRGLWSMFVLGSQGDGQQCALTASCTCCDSFIRAAARASGNGWPERPVHWLRPHSCRGPRWDLNPGGVASAFAPLAVQDQGVAPPSFLRGSLPARPLSGQRLRVFGGQVRKTWGDLRRLPHPPCQRAHS